MILQYFNFKVASRTVAILYCVITTVSTVYSPSCLRQEKAKGPLGLRVTLPPTHHTWRLRTDPFNAERQTGKL